MTRLAAVLLAGFWVVTGIFPGRASADPPDALIEAARREGRVDSVGMPDDWANWKDCWAGLARKYGLAHQDTDMSSAQEIAKFEAEKGNATADIGDVGHAFGPIAARKGVALPYQPASWSQIPDWAKDRDGYWVIAYTGTIAFIVNTDLVKDPPKSWADLKNGTYKVALGDVGVASQANSGVLAAAYATGGDERNIAPALALFADLARHHRLSLNAPTLANLEKGEIEVGVLWDFNALNYRDRIGRQRFAVIIPADGSVTSGYSTIINKYAKHPNAAKLTRDYILSDEGQINLAKGYARPIRDVALPAEVADRLLPAAAYAKARPVGDFAAWEAMSKQLPRLWQEQVLFLQQ